MDLKEFIIVVIYFAAANGVPTSRDESCATKCQKNDKFNYVVGNTYIYDYTAQTESKVAGSSKDLTQLKVNTKVHITAVSPCNMELKLHDISVVQSNSNNAKVLNPSKHSNFKSELETYPLMFAFVDGLVDHVCPQSGDSAWSVNFKRGFLTTLQNTMKDLNRNEMLEEVDVSGQCLINYVISKRGWSSIFITKTKDLDSCTKRSGAENIGIQFAPHFSNLATHPLPVLKSEAKCDQVIDTESHILHSAKCMEIHVLRPFSNGAAGVVTTTKQEVNFVQRKSALKTRMLPQTVRTSLLYDHQKEVAKLNGNIEEVETTLQDMCASQTITLHTPTFFKSLVIKMRQLEESQLFSVYNHINKLCPGNEVLANKFFLDALHMTVTPASAALIIRLIQSDHISNEMKDSWLLTLAFIPSPTKEFVMKFAVLLDEKKPTKNTLLGLSALIHTYCHQPSIECSEDLDLKMFSEKFTNYLKTGCQGEKNTTEKILIALKAIGNVGFLTKAEEKLESCYFNSKTDVAVRVAAIDALRRWPCDTQHESLIKIVNDYEEDVEVRLTSYLSLMRCPSKETLESVRRMLETEQINQVGSFIWTHLTNLQKTSIRYQTKIKSIVQSFVLRQKFSTDALKFSRAYEKSFRSEAYQTGLHAQANLVFTPKSYLPRSLTTNLTVDLFGRAINLIEIGGRMEGFEQWIESFFGPNGYFPEKTVQDALKSMRGKRDIGDNHMEDLHDQFKAQSEFPDPRASAYIRLFGNDIFYSQYQGQKNLDHVLARLMKDEETSITESFTFVDTSLVIPTQIGLPLNLTLNGTAIIQLLMKGHTQIRQIFNLDCDVSGYIKPSAAVQITGSMSVNMPDLALGVRLDATLHTSTAISGKLVLKGGRLVNVQIDAPEDRVDVININSQLFVMEGDDAPQASPEFSVARFDFEGCSGTLTKTVFGLDICAAISYPNASEMATAPGFPLTGPALFSIYIEKSDPLLTSYNFEYQWEDNKIGDQFIRTKWVYLDTPGASTDRQFSAEVVVDEPGQTIKASLRTPFKKFGLQGKIVNEENEKRLDGTMTIDDIEKIVLLAELKKEEYGDTQRYSPRLHVQLPYIRPIDLKGYLTIQNGVKIALDMSLENLTLRPITMIGDMSIANNLFNIDLTLKSFLITTNVKANVQTAEKHLTGNINTEISLLERWHRRYGLNFKYRDESSSSIRKLLASGEIQGSELEPLTIAWELQHRKNYIENQLDFKANKKTLTTKQVFTYGKDSKNNEKFTATLIANCPSTNFDWALTAVHQRNLGAMTSQIEIYKGKTIVGKIQTNAHAHLIPLMNLGAELSVQAPGHDVAAAANVKRLNANEYEGKIYVQLQPGKKAQIHARYQDYSTSDNRRHSIKIDATSPWSAPFLLESDLDTKNGAFSTNNVLNVNAKKYLLMVDYDPKSDAGHQLKTAASIAGKSYGGDASYRSNEGTTAFRVNLKRFGYHPLSVKLELTLNDNDVIGDARITWKPEEESGVRFEYNKRGNGFRVGLKADGISGMHVANFETSTEGSVAGSSISHESTGSLVTNRKEYKAQLKFASARHDGVTDGSVYAQVGLVGRVYRLEGNYTFDGNSWVGSVQFENDRMKTFRGRTSGSVSKWDYPEFDFNGILEMGHSDDEKYVFGINHVNTRERFFSSIKLPLMRNSKSFNFSIQGRQKRNVNDVQYSGRADLNIEKGDSYSMYGMTKTPGSGHFITQLGTNENYITLQFDTRVDNVDQISRQTASFSFTSSLKNFENVRAFVKNELYNASFASVISASWSPDDFLDLRAIASWQLDNEGWNLHLAGQLRTPFDEMRNLSVVVDHEWRRNQLNASFVVGKNSKDIAMFALEGFFPAIDHGDFKMQIKLPNLHKISGGFNYKLLDKQFDASFDFANGNEEIKGNLNAVSSPGDEFKNFKLTSGVWFRNEKKYSLDFETKNENSKRLVTLTATTPSGTYGPYQGEYMWSNNEGIQELTFGLEYAPGRKFAIGATTDVGQYKGRIQMDVYIQFEDLHKISAVVTYDFFEPTRVGLEVQWDGDKKIEINAVGRLTLMNSDVQIGAITSFGGYENITVGIQYDFRSSIRKKSLTTTVSVKDQLFKMQATGVCNNAGGEFDVQIGTPYDEWKIVGGKLKFNPNRDGVSARVQLRRNEKKIEGALVLRPLRVTARLRTPYTNFRSTVVEWKMEKGEHSLISTLSLKKDTFVMDASATYERTSKDDFNVDANVKIPSIDVRLGLTATAHLSEKRVEGNVELTHNDNKINATAQMLNEVKQKDLILIFASPLRGFEEIKVSASYVIKDPFYHVASFNIEQNSKNVHFIARLTHENNAVVASLALTSDYALIPSFVVAAEQDYSTPTKSASFTLSLGEMHLKLRAESTTEYTLREGSLSFASNFGGVDKELSGSYSYDLGRPQKVVTLQFAKDGRAIDVRGTYEFNTEQHPGSLVLSVEDGINGQYVYGLNINYEMLKHVKVVDCIVHKGRWMSDFTIKWSVDDGVFDFTSELLVPGTSMSLQGEIGDTFIKLKGGHNDQVAEITGRIRKENGRATFELISSSTGQLLSGWSLTGGYDVHAKEKSVWLHAKGDGKTAEMTGSYVLESVKGKVELKLKATDDQSQGSWSSLLMAYFDLTTSQRNAGVNLQMDDDAFDVKLKWTPGKHKGIVKIEITTPIVDCRSLGGELQYNLDRAKTVVSSYVQWADSKRVSVDLSVSIVNVIGSLVIHTPFPNTKTIEVRLAPSFDTEKKNIQLSIKYGNQKEIRLNIDWSIDRQVGELQFKVDSTFADFKRFAVKFTYDNMKMQLAMSWPGETDRSKDLLATYENSGYAMLDAEISFGAFSKLFKTSGMNFKYDLRSDNKWGEFSVKRGDEKVELRTSYTAGSLVRMILHTPHPDYKTISGEITFDRNEQSATVNAKWNEKSIEFLALLKVNTFACHLESSLESNWEAIHSGKILFQYDLKATRPFLTAQYGHMGNIVDLHLETGITISEHYAILFPLVQKDKSLIEATINWNNIQTVQFIVEGGQDLLSIKLKTPFSPCENNYVQTSYEVNPSLWSVKFSSAVCEQETHVAGELHMAERKWSVNSYWRSDFFAPGLLDGALDLNASGDNGWLTVQWAHSTIEVKGRVNLDDRKMTTRLVLRNSFIENTVVVVGNYDASTPNHKYDFEMDFGDGNRILVVGEVDTEDRNVTGGNMRLMTPVKGMEDIYLKLKYINNKFMWLGECLLTWGSSEDRKFEMNSLLTEKDFNFDIKTPLRLLRNLHVNTTVENRQHLLEFEAKISWNDKTLLDTLVKLDQNLPDSLYFGLDFYTPLTEEVSSIFSFAYDGKKKTNAFLLVKCHKLLINMGGHYVHRRSFNATGQFEFGATKTDILANWDEGVVDFSADIISPMLDTERMSIIGKGTYTDTSGNIELHAKCSESAHSIIADFNWQNSKFDGSATINCPLIANTQTTVKFHGTYSPDTIYTNVEVDSNHRFQLRLSNGAEKKMEIVFDTSATSLKIIETSLAARDNGFKAFGYVKTVENTYEMTVISNKSLSTSIRHISVNANFGNHHILIFWDVSPQLIAAKLQLNSPSLQRSPLIINMRIENRSSPAQMIIFKWDIILKAEKLVDFSLLMQKSTRKWSMKTTLDTNYLNIRNVSLQTSLDTNNGVKLVIRAGRLLNYHSLSFALLRFHSLRERPEVNISLVMHENSLSEKNLTMAIVFSTSNNIDIQLLLTSAGGRKDLEALLHLFTTFDGGYAFDMKMETLSTGVIEILGSVLCKASKLELELQFLKNYRKHSLFLINLWIDPTLDFNFELSSPLLKPSVIQSRLYLDKTRKSENSIQGSLIIDQHSYSISGLLVSKEKFIGGHLAFTSSRWDPLRVMFEIAKNDRDGQINVDLIIGDKKLEAKGSYHNPNSEKLDLDLLITTPFKGIDWIKVIANLSKSEFAIAKLKMTSSHRKLNGILIRGSLDPSHQKPKVKLSVRTPFEALPSLEADGSLDYSNDFSDIVADLAVLTPDKAYNFHFKSKLTNHQGSGSDIRVTTGVDVDDKKYGFQFTGKYSRDKALGMALEAIFASKKIFSSELDYEVDELTKHLTVVVDVEEIGRYFVNVKISPTIYRIDIATPYETMRKMYAEYTHLDHNSLRGYSLELTDSNDRNWYVGIDHAVGQVKLELETPLEYLLEAHVSISKNSEKTKMSFSYHGLRHVDAEMSRKGNSYKLKMTDPLQFDAVWTTNTSANGTIITIGEVTTDINQRTTTTSAFIYQQHGNGVKLSLQSRDSFFVMTTLVDRTETGLQRSLNVTFDGQPLLKLNMMLENKHLHQSVEKSFVLTLWYPDKEVSFLMRQEIGSNIWSSGVKMSLERGRVFGLILNVIPNGHFNLRLQLPEESLYFQLTQIRASRKNAYELQAYLGFLNRPDLAIELNFKWLNSNGQVNAEFALVQPKAEMRARASLIDGKNEVQLKLDVEAKLQSKVNYIFTSQMIYNKLQKTLEIDVKHPPHLDDLKLLANFKSADDKDVLELNLVETDAQMKHKKLFEGSIEVHNKSVLFNYIYGNGETIAALFSMPSFKSIEVDISQGFPNSLMSEFNSTLTLNSSRSLIGNINWRPGAIWGAAEKFVSGYFDTKDKAIDVGLKLQETLYFALQCQKIEAMEILDSIKQRVADTLERETRGFSEDINNLAREVKKLYDEDKFGIKTFAERIDHDYGAYVRSMCHYMLDIYSHFTYELRHGSEKMYQYFADLGRGFLSHMDGLVLRVQHGMHDLAQDPDGTVRLVHKRLSGLLMQMAAHIKEKLTDPLVLKATPHITHLIDQLGSKFQQIAITCTEHLSELIRASKKVPAIQQMMQFVADWVPDKETLKILDDYYRQIVSKCTEIFEEGTKVVESWTKHPAVVQLTDCVSKMGDKLTWLYNYMEIEKHVTSVLETIVNKVKETCVELMQEVVSDLPHFNYHVPQVIIDADKGRMIFSQRLPFEWESFRHLPKFKLDKEVASLKKLKDQILERTQDLSFSDIWNNEWSKLSFQYGFGPKFEGRAFLAGQQHYKTFDGHYYEFAGSCSYILASDFVDRKFTAVVNYVNNKKESIALQFGKTELEVSTADGNLKVDGQKTEYPLQLGSVTAVRTGDFVTIRQGRNFQLLCSIQFDVCFIDVHGFYHGKTGGLFGNFDKEESNDLLMSNQKRTKDIVEFARSWQLQDCQTGTNLAKINSDDGQFTPTTCRDLLDDINSPLQKCFKKVTPTPYFQMCMNDFVNTYTTSKKAAMTVLATYVSECNYNGAKVEMPDEFVYCSISNSRQFTAQNAIRFSGNEEFRSADTVLLVEESNCNRDKKFAQDVVTAIENGLSEHNVQTNQYGLVGFSGDGIHDLPHIHTINGQVFGSWHDLTAQALPKLQVGKGSTDLLTSLRFVTDMPFRPGVRRNVVAFLCNSQTSTSDLDLIQKQMNSQGIVLHVISNVNFKSDVIGCDKAQAYTTKAETRIACPAQFLQSVESKIALQSNGSVFSSSHLKSPKPRVSKRALDLLVNRIVEKSMPICQVCQCVGTGKSLCKPCKEEVMFMDDATLH